MECFAKNVSPRPGGGPRPHSETQTVSENRDLSKWCNVPKAPAVGRAGADIFLQNVATRKSEVT